MDDEYLNEFPISDGLDFFIQNPNRTLKDGLWLLFFPFGYGYIYTTIQIRLCASFTNYMNEPIWRKKKDNYFTNFCLFFQNKCFQYNKRQQMY
jgi:hypothetical protein